MTNEMELENKKERKTIFKKIIKYGFAIILASFLFLFIYNIKYKLSCHYVFPIDFKYNYENSDLAEREKQVLMIAKNHVNELENEGHFNFPSFNDFGKPYNAELVQNVWHVKSYFNQVENSWFDKCEGPAVGIEVLISNENLEVIKFNLSK